MPGSGPKLTRREAEIAVSFGEDLAKLNEPAAFPDHVEEIAMLPGRRIGPFAGCAFPRPGSAQPNKHRSAGSVASVSNDPIVADAPPVGKIVTADVLGLFCEPASKIRCLDGHGQSPKDEG